jgi:predicted DNA-binding transcriptional regulator YafY
MNRIDRLFGISTLLQSNKFTTAEQIAAKFEISVRTVYRDLKSLNELGIPICYEPNKGYHLISGYFLPPVSFNLEEASAFLLMEQLLSAFSDQSIKKNYQNALEKIKSVLKQSQKEKIEQLASNMYLQLPERLTNDYEFLSIIQSAISHKNILELEYKDAKEEVSQRKVEAIGLIFYAFSWHLIGWCHLRKDYRDFKVSRIITVKNLQVQFNKENHIPLSDYLKLLPVTY